MGLFPCAPVAPSLAVDLRVLQFVKTLFMQQTPNMTAWCEAVEVFLAGRGYTFAGKQCRTRGHSGRVVALDGIEDVVEEGMRVPVSVLDGCGQSFIAADERRKKASTQFFADTGLMALLCRHDRVLWLVNLTSAREKQHYALALLKQFIAHIPNDMRVGFLYDIGCQIECSWRKWKFFDDSILSRFQFGVSVFHAYGQSKNKVDKEIGMILELEQLVKARAATISALELRFMANRITDFASFKLDIADTRAQYDKLSDMLLRRCAALGVSATARLRQLCHSKYLQVRVNALAVKTQICDRLRGRKFELERMENAYHQSAGEQRLHVHTEVAVKCHEPTLLRLISTYNSLCETLAALIRRRQAVHGAVAPCPIACEGLYDLDVDDDIWQDIGLNDDSVNPPPWLADENDRCQEEEGRLARERCNLQEWIGAEWDGVCAALASHAESGDVGMVCQLELRKKGLVDLVKVWQGQIGLVPAAWEMPLDWIEGDIDLPVVPGEVEQMADFEEWESDREDQGD
ncbi:hypothetical protein BDN67DRAFT_985641, partial [Paxillus ammoniavirescens]